MTRARLDAAGRVAGAIRALLSPFQGEIRIETVESRPWRSVTFAGGRHRFHLQLAGGDAARAADLLLSRMSENRIEVPGHWLADLQAIGEERADDGRRVGLALEAITVEKI